MCLSYEGLRAKSKWDPGYLRDVITCRHLNCTRLVSLEADPLDEMVREEYVDILPV